MTRIEKMEHYGNEIEKLIKELDILCDHSYYLKNRELFFKEKEKFEKNESNGNRNNLTTAVDHYARFLAIFKLIRAKY